LVSRRQQDVDARDKRGHDGRENDSTASEHEASRHQADVMTTGRLFVSFWNICLENLPEGGFTCRRVAPDEARLAIEQAREGGTLLCLSETDLLAPYHKRECGNHDALCLVLKDHFGIVLSLRDFYGRAGDDDDSLYCINPLNCVRVEDGNRLMIITCAYVLADEIGEGPLQFKIEPTTVKFYVVEVAAL
jgi:hypothetical protein